MQSRHIARSTMSLSEGVEYYFRFVPFKLNLCVPAVLIMRNSQQLTLHPALIFARFRLQACFDMLAGEILEPGRERIDI